MNNLPLYSFSIWIEKIINKGEDAKPILKFDKADIGLMAVFDGLGGAGSSLYENNGDMVSGAYYSARIVREEVKNFFVDNINRSISPGSWWPDFKELELLLTNLLKERIILLDKTPSKLKSNLIKRLPTTLAGIYFYKSGRSEQYECISFWAGDSRSYLLLPDAGIQQITKDDLRTVGDALQNLLEDSPISNYINADTPFQIRHAITRIKAPCIFITATDGCFGYVPTPMHFEYLLLDTLLQSTSEIEWEGRLTEAYKQIASDDVSMALIAVGWKEFQHLKESFVARHRLLKETYIEPFDKIDARYNELSQQETQISKLRQECNEERQKTRQELWVCYKTEYEARIQPARISDIGLSSNPNKIL